MIGEPEILIASLFPKIVPTIKDKTKLPEDAITENAFLSPKDMKKVVDQIFNLIPIKPIHSLSKYGP